MFRCAGRVTQKRTRCVSIGISDKTTIGNIVSVFNRGRDVVITIMTAVRLDRLDVVNAVYTRAATTAYVAKVARFLGSEVDWISGTVPMVQSQHRSHGNISSHAFTLTK